jgi:hypothetical protein
MMLKTFLNVLPEDSLICIKKTGDDIPIFMGRVDSYWRNYAKLHHVFKRIVKAIPHEDNGTYITIYIFSLQSLLHLGVKRIIARVGEDLL